MSEIHAAVRAGFAAEADAYVRGRPDYPAALKDWLEDEIGLGPGRRVVDLAAGTGKFAPLLLRMGAEVVAVEPVPSMRAATGPETVQAPASPKRTSGVPGRNGCSSTVAGIA